MMKAVRAGLKRTLGIAGLRTCTEQGRIVLRRAGLPLAGVRYELCGPAGVGKTTLAKAARRRMRGAYLGAEDLDAQPVTGAGSRAVAGGPLAALWKWQVSMTMTGDLPLPEKLAQLNYHSRVLLREIAMFDPALDLGVLLDEGLCLCYRDALLAMPEPSFHGCVEGRTLLHLTTRQPARIADQIIARRDRSAVLRRGHRGLTRDELVERATLSMARSAAVVDRACRLGLPVLELLAEDGLDANVEKLLALEAAEIAARQQGRAAMIPGARGRGSQGRVGEAP